MASQPSKPALVIVHGAWHVPAHYDDFVQQLEQHDFEVFCPLLPTCSGARPASATLGDDVSSIRSLIQLLLDTTGRTIIVIAHSYGGIVGIEAVQALSITERKAKGLQGGVVHIIYMAAFMPQVGESVGGLSLPRPDPDPVEVADDGTSFLCTNTKQLFFNDMDDEAAEKASSMLVRHCAAAMGGSLTFPAWKYVPATYIATTLDMVLFPEWQKGMIDAVRKEGVHLNVRTYDASHSPYLSMTKQMVDVVEDVAKGYSL